jgi:hypothetical protein
MRRGFFLVLTITGMIIASNPSLVSAAGQGKLCGGIAGIKCDGKLWCDPTPGQCGGADISGKCVRVPQVCTMDWKPVCGCDNRTYSNDCVRRAVKVAKKSDGECKDAK